MPTHEIISRFGDSAGGKQRGITLILTHDCNLRCNYCFQRSKAPGFRMDFNLATAVIEEIVRSDRDYDRFAIEFFGGEPFLEFSLIRDIVDWYWEQDWARDTVFHLSTNGTILTDEMRRWLPKHRGHLLVSVSLDGNKRAHDLNRSGSYDRVKRNLPFFIAHWPKQAVKMTISAESIPLVADSLIEFEELGLNFSVNVALEDIWGRPEQKSELLNEYDKQLDRLVDYYLAHPELIPPDVLNRHFSEPASRDHPSELSADNIRWCGAGHELLAIDSDGARYPCHRFPSWVTGVPAPRHLANHHARWKPDRCDACPYVLICPTCAALNWQENGDSATRTTHHCESFLLEIRASAKLAALQLGQRDQAAIDQLTWEERAMAHARLTSALSILADDTAKVP